MANTLTGLMPTLYAALDIVSREMVGFIPAVAINAAPTGVAKGETVTIPVTPTAQTHDITPGQLPGNNGDQEIGTVNMEITKFKYAPVRWNGEEQLGVNNTGVYNQILAAQFAQAMRALANEVDADIAALYKEASCAYGTPGTTPFESSIKDMAQVRKLLVDNGAPLTDLQLVLDTTAGANLRSLGQLTKANEANTDATLRRGVLLDLAGFAIRESGQVATHVAGSFTGDALVNNAGGYEKGSTTIAVDGASAIALKAGDAIQFGSAGRRYLVAADANATPVALAKPGLMAAVADDTAIAVAAGYTANMAFDRNALQLLARTPAMPQGGDMADDVTAVTDPVSGISFQVAVYREYRQIRYEIGLAWGVKCIKPEHVALLLG